MKHTLKKATLLLALLCIGAVAATAQTDRGVVGKVFTGYQGWFNNPSDGSGLNNWRHWFDAAASANSNQMIFEMFPDVSEYGPSDVATIPGARNMGNLGNGEPAQLFSSWRESVIDTHVRWMKENEIDGMALQRFGSYTNAGTLRNVSDSIAVRLLRAAERHDRLFYIMWDWNPTLAQLQGDWNHLRNNIGITNFASYAHQDGKPVVCLWGVGLNSRGPNNADNAANWLAIINWLKSPEGGNCYVIGGTPRDWRTNSGDAHTDPAFTEAYRALDMVSPWWVGRVQLGDLWENTHQNRITNDRNYCLEHGMEFQPVIFPGFAWSQWKEGTGNNHVNEFPRHNVRSNAMHSFAWEQYRRLRERGADKNLYLAMFDEYDEGTNWMKNATDFTQIPTNQYFLTASADGYWLSSDYQLRIAREISRAQKNPDKATALPAMPPLFHSEGPVYYRNSFELRESTLEKSDRNATTIGGVRFYKIDPGFFSPTEISQSNVSNRAAEVMLNEAGARSGRFVARFTGTASGTSSSFYHKFGDTRLQVKEGMRLSFWKYAVNERGLNTTVSLRFDGTPNTFLHTTALTDLSGIGVNPSNPRGTVGTWTRHEVVIGQGDLIGRIINGLVFGYEGAGSGNFEVYFDDILIADGGPNVPIVNAAAPNIAVHPVGVTYATNAVVDLRVAARSPDGGTLSYQWYSNTENNTTGGTPVGANSNRHSPSTENAGTLYYYVVITNTNATVNGTQATSITSNPVAIVVTN